MASKKKNPSFEIPDAVRQAGQSGWVYRTDAPARSAPRSAAGPRRAHQPPVAAAPAPKLAKPEPIAPVSPTPVAPTVAAEPASAAGLVERGLQVVAVPFVVPLFVTAAISRKLGLLGR